MILLHESSDVTISDCIFSIIYQRDFLLKQDKNKPAEFIQLKNKFVNEVQDDLNFIWNNRKKLVMNIDVLAKWFPENWKNMNELQLYGHFNRFFCAEMRFVKERGKYFEQLLSSKIFGGTLRNGSSSHAREMYRP